MDKWFRETEQPIIYKDLKRQQYTYPSFMPIDPFVMLQKGGGGTGKSPKFILLEGRILCMLIADIKPFPIYTIIG